MTVTEPTAERSAESQPDVAAPAEATTVDEVLVEEVLVEEISIDGMCGVY